ncbi:MAG: response regulator [Bacteroidetes bacterium]|nr:response regulator [Bacteroidota bacterium]
MVKKVLIVEDDMILSMVNKRYVESLGHEVVKSVRNGPDAVEAARTLNPDVILMDIRIEGTMDGIDAMDEIRKFSDVAVVYLTGNSDPATKLRAQQTNVLAFCIKPISIDDLKNILNP